MPRDGSGVYTLPAGNPVVTGTVIATTWANPTMSDIAAQLNNVLTRDGLLGPTGPFKLQDGTVAAPGLAWASEPGLGFYRPGAGNLSFAVRGNEMAAFIMSGNDANFALKKTASGAANQLLGYTGNSIRWAIIPGDGLVESGSNTGSDFVIARFSDTGAPLGSVLNIGRATGGAIFGVSATSPGFYLSGINAGAWYNSGTTQVFQHGTNWYWSFNGSTGELGWNRNGIPATVFGADGAFYAGGNRIFTGNGGSMGLLDNPAGARILRFTGDGWRVEWPGNGDLIYSNPSATLFVFGNNGVGYNASGQTTWSPISDIRLKSNVAPLAYGLDEILQLEPITYDIYETKGAVGLSAQDVHTVMPRAGSVAKNMDPESDLKEVLTYNADYVYFALINAIKTLNDRITQLETA